MENINTAQDGYSGDLLDGDAMEGMDDHSEEQNFMHEDKIELVIFELNDQRFGINIQDTNEVKDIPELTEVFHTPEFLLGVLNLRGDIVALLDIGLFFGMPPSKIEDQSMIVLEHDQQEASILAESLHGVQLIDENEIQPPPPTISGVSGEWIEGIIQKNDDPWIMLDIPAIFKSDRLQDL